MPRRDLEDGDLAALLCFLALPPLCPLPGLLSLPLSSSLLASAASRAFFLEDLEGVARLLSRPESSSSLGCFLDLEEERLEGVFFPSSSSSSSSEAAFLDFLEPAGMVKAWDTGFIASNHI